MGDPETPMSEENDKPQWPAPYGPPSVARDIPGPAVPAPGASQAGSDAPVWPSATSGQPPHGQPPYSGQPLHGQPPFGQQPPSYPPLPSYTRASYNQPPYTQGPYSQPPYGPPEQAYNREPQGAPQGPSRHAKGLRSAATVLVIVAAGVAGAGVSRIAWPSGQFANNAAPATTTPTSAGGGGGFGSFPPPFGGSGGNGSGSSEGAGGPSDVAAIASKVDPAVVDINSTFNYQDAEGAGTGIVLTSKGEILTNNHVIDGETKISVADVGNGNTYQATVVGYDSTHDIAVLQLQGASGLQTVKFSHSSPSIGEAVVAIGNAGGTGGTPTSAGGSITALHQSITANDELTGGSEQLAGLIEVNANVEAGDSGGPLVNAAGQVVGMDTAASESFAFSTQGNEGFAIPLSEALAIARQIEAGNGSSTVHVGQTGFLGLLESVSASQSFLGGGENPYASGVDIGSVVPGSPAQEAGITGGDVVTALDGHTVSTVEQLAHLMVPHHPGDKVSITWVDTFGHSHTTTVSLASGPPA